MVGGFAFGRTFAMGNNPCLSITFPSLFLLAVNKEALVADLWNPIGEEGGWSPHFSRSFNDWELEEVQSFLHVIQRKRVISSGEDRLLMKDVKDGRFLVKLFYLLLDLAKDLLFPSRLVWNPWVPTEVGFFAWEAS